jgi:predicted GNAT family acetyltransferase
VIKKEVAGSKGRYFIEHDSGVSELSYSVTSPALVIADHTAVADGHNGQGIGLVLLEQLLAAAQTEGFKVLPLCPFVNAQRRRHPEWDNLFST